jgi:DNA-binding GntR family transcriptional regulator
MSLFEPEAIDFDDDDRPIYVQIAAQPRQAINEGLLAPGDAIPSEAVMVKAYEVARGTVRQARSLLEQEKLIKKRRGKPPVVA